MHHHPVLRLWVSLPNIALFFALTIVFLVVVLSAAAGAPGAVSDQPMHAPPGLGL
jgi:hypothetical protein